jgi:hypothetical protein
MSTPPRGAPVMSLPRVQRSVTAASVWTPGAWCETMGAALDVSPTGADEHSHRVHCQRAGRWSRASASRSSRKEPQRDSLGRALGNKRLRSGGRATAHGAAGQKAPLLPTQTSGQDGPRRADAPRPRRGSGRRGPRRLVAYGPASFSHVRELSISGASRRVALGTANGTPGALDEA